MPGATMQPVNTITELQKTLIYLKRLTYLKGVAVWHNGSDLLLIDEVNLCQARLLLECVTMSRFDSRGDTLFRGCNQPPRTTQPSALCGAVK